MDNKISIIIPLYNYESYIGDCIKSIQDQTYKNWEAIIVDDCSTDNSYKTAKLYESDKIKVYMTEENKGLPFVKNVAIKKSTGKYFVHLDSDDMLTSDSLEIRIKKMISDSSIGVLHAKAYKVSNNFCYNDILSVDKEKLSESESDVVHPQTIMVARWVYEKFGLYDDRLRYREYREMIWRLFGEKDNNHRVKRVFLDDFVAFYRIHEKSESAQYYKDKSIYKEYTKILKETYKKRQIDVRNDNTEFLEKIN